MTDSKATDRAGEPSNADILRELRQIKSEVGQLKEGQNALQIKVGKIETRLNFHFLGLGLLLGINGLASHRSERQNQPI